MHPTSQEDLLRRTGSLLASTLGSTVGGVGAVVGHLAKDGGDKLGAALRFSVVHSAHFKAIAASAVVWQVGRACSSWAFQDQMDAPAIMRDRTKQFFAEEAGSQSQRTASLPVSRPFAYASVQSTPKFAASSAGPAASGVAAMGGQTAEARAYSRWELEAALQSSKM